MGKPCSILVGAFLDLLIRDSPLGLFGLVEPAAQAGLFSTHDTVGSDVATLAWQFPVDGGSLSGARGAGTLGGGGRMTRELPLVAVLDFVSARDPEAWAAR